MLGLNIQHYHGNKHTNFSTSPVSIVGSVIINHHRMTAYPAGSLCVHGSVLIPWPRWPASAPSVSAEAVVVTHWHLWQRSQTVKASIAGAHVVLRLTSLTVGHLNHTFLIYTGRQHGKYDSVSDGLTGWPVMPLTDLNCTSHKIMQICVNASLLEDLNFFLFCILLIIWIQM